MIVILTYPSVELGLSENHVSAILRYRVSLSVSPSFVARSMRVGPATIQNRLVIVAVTTMVAAIEEAEAWFKEDRKERKPRSAEKRKRYMVVE